MSPTSSDDVWARFFDEALVLSQRREVPGSSISRLLEQSVKKVRVTQGAPSAARARWDARRFRLDTSAVFASWPEAARAAVLEALSDHSLATSVFIEKGAITYCARMALEADTVEEKALFMVMGQEEVVHLLEFERLASPKVLAAPPSRFIRTLNELLQVSDRATSVLVAQVLLEGMAMQHYDVLRESCVDDDMARVINRVLIDEARHHGSGLVLLERAELTPERVGRMTDVAVQVVTMMTQQGQALLDVLRRVAALHGVSADDETLGRLAKEIDLPAQMRARAGSVREALHKLKRPELHPLISAVDAAG
ncbi:MAG: ferritin-like domain-containing protein, partial [Archangium sp.]|nr:ferritin-like domain-containing protein [Archangium sp.]